MKECFLYQFCQLKHKRACACRQTPKSAHNQFTKKTQLILQAICNCVAAVNISNALYLVWYEKFAWANGKCHECIIWCVLFRKFFGFLSLVRNGNEWNNRKNEINFTALWVRDDVDGWNIKWCLFAVQHATHKYIPSIAFNERPKCI